MDLKQRIGRVAIDEMLLVKGERASAGSRMLADTVSLFDSTVVKRLRACGYTELLRSGVSEFSIGLTDGATGAAELLRQGLADACVVLDVNGSGRRAAAQASLAYLKPTYGSISRFGAVSAVPSGETVAVMARCVETCKELLDVLVGNDELDGTSLDDSLCARVRMPHGEVRSVALCEDFTSGLDEGMKTRILAAEHALRAQGVEVVSVSEGMLANARAAWNTVLCAELSKSTARYDGVRFGLRAKGCNTLNEVYEKSRGEGFGTLLKCAVAYGSDVLSAENYESVYCKALRVRTLVRECMESLLEEFDALLLPAASVECYSERWLSLYEYPAFGENLYTAPASLTGLPSAVAGGVQLIGRAFGEGELLAAAKILQGGTGREL